MAHSTASAIVTTPALDRLFEGLTQRYPHLSSETRWHLAHQARVLAAWLATAVATGWERYKVHGLFVSQARWYVTCGSLYASVMKQGSPLAAARARCLRKAHCRRFRLATFPARQRSLLPVSTPHRERPEDTELAVHLFLDEDGQPAGYQGHLWGWQWHLQCWHASRSDQVNRRVAVTGEVLADGTLTKVDGIPEKLQAW